jgi:phage portal protein BeeE
MATILSNPFKRSTPAPPPDTQIDGYMITPRGVRSIKGYAGTPNFYYFNDIPTEEQLTPTLSGVAFAFSASVWIYRCAWARANAVAGIPLMVLDHEENELPNSHLGRLLAPLNRDMQKRIELDLCIFGHAFGKPYFDGHRWSIRRWNPQTVQVIPGPGGYGIAKYIQRVGGWVTEAFPDEIVHYRYYDPNNDFGSISPALVALRAVQADVGAWDYVVSFFQNDATPSLFITTEATMQLPDIDRIAAQWSKDHQGARRSHKPKFGHKGMNVTQLQSAMRDLVIPELDEGIKFRICAAMGVPMTVALATEAANYATADIMRKAFYTEQILPEMDMITDEMNRQLVPIVCRYEHHKPTVTYDKDDIEALQGTPLEKSQRAQMGYQAGVRSLNEARALEELPDLPVDYFLVSGQLVPRNEIEVGQLPTITPPSLFNLPSTGNYNRLPQPNVIDMPLANKALYSSILTELKQWQNKALNRGTKSSFKAEFIPPATAAFIKMDLQAVHPDNGDVVAQVKAIFSGVEATFKQLDPDLATPEEFEDYWQGFDTAYDEIQSLFADYFATLPSHMANTVRNGTPLITLDDAGLVELLMGTPDAPGPLMVSFLAGSARGNDLYNRATTKAMKQGGVGVAWDILSQEAIDYARNYAFGMVQGINATTQKIYQDAMATWLQDGGTLTDLADLIEGQLPATIPPNWTGGKLAWATSPERAYLIAQQETAVAYQQGVTQRWSQLGVNKARFRTANDARVCLEICKPLNNAEGELINGQYVWVLNGQQYTIPAHIGCRCFAAVIL